MKEDGEGLRSPNISISSRKKISATYQYIYGFIVVFCGFVLGTTIGWASPAQHILVHKNKDVSNNRFSWVASVMPLGAALSQFISGFVMDWMGRKWALWLLLMMALCSWAVLTVHTYYWLLVGARVAQGLSVGGFCVICPMYVGEIADKYRRGAISVCFQLFTVCGIEFAYVIGLLEKYMLLNMSCAIAAVFAVLTVVFVPDTPYFYVMKRHTEKAFTVMEKVRGRSYDFTLEMVQFEILRDQKGTRGICGEIRRKYNMKAFLILLVLHLLQQFSGVNALLYYADSLFDATESYVPSTLSVVILGASQIVMTIITALVVDRVGRRIMWMASLVTMCLSLALLGSYFTLKKISEKLGKTLGIIPTVSIVIYITGFSIGAGPLAWTMIGEFFAGNVGATLGTIVAFCNWMMAFFITLTFPAVAKFLGSNLDLFFYALSAVCLVGAIFVFIFVVETKKKSLKEIQMDLANNRTALRLKERGEEEWMSRSRMNV